MPRIVTKPNDNHTSPIHHTQHRRIVLSLDVIVACFATHRLDREEEHYNERTRDNEVGRDMRWQIRE